MLPYTEAGASQNPDVERKTIYPGINPWFSNDFSPEH
jgi:hypothetical protein